MAYISRLGCFSQFLENVSYNGILRITCGNSVFFLILLNLLVFISVVKAICFQILFGSEFNISWMLFFSVCISLRSLYLRVGYVF
jgi:hypothetical protein